MTTEERVAKIDEMCQELFEANKMFTPLYPWIFILVCQKTQRVGHIITPDKQNKPVHEGIVLAVWEDKVIEKRRATSDGKHETVFETKRSELMPGDHVVFHHSAGQPAHGYNPDRFRVVRECDWSMQTHGGGIVGRIEYDDEKTASVLKLIRLIAEQGVVNDRPVADLPATITERFVVVDREAGSVTLSGV
jgi:co-chaperonin GroES (HSP10)